MAVTQERGNERKKPDFQGLFGLLKAEQGVSLDEMDEAIQQHAKAKFHDCD